VLSYPIIQYNAERCNLLAKINKEMLMWTVQSSFYSTGLFLGSQPSKSADVKTGANRLHRFVATNKFEAIPEPLLVSSCFLYCIPIIPIKTASMSRI
jgi:hypothetical protein